MGFLLKPEFLKTAKSAADVQKLMKLDLKNNVGRKNVKFVAAKNCVIAGKTTHLFIVTDAPAPFETVLKATQRTAQRAKGTCDLARGQVSGKTMVTIKTASGQLPAASLVKLLPLALANDKNFVAYAEGSSGVAQWARKEYKRTAKRFLMASMTPDGKIGSLYFSNNSRIRTTHGAGPSQESHKGKTTVQFNINEALAIPAFEKAEPEKAATPQYWDHFDKWLATNLENVTATSLPPWATLLGGPNTAYKTSQGAPPDDLKLFEIFKSVTGKVESWHPSRGTGVKYKTDKQTVSVLEAAIKHIDKVSPMPTGRVTKEELNKVVNKRNTEFYNFVKSRLPSAPIVQAMRRPDEIR